MNTVAIVCNILSFVFTCFVLATDGAPTDAAYVAFTLLLLIIPIFTVFAVVRQRADGKSVTRITQLAGICNLLLLGFICWAIVDQYPHPDEEGFLEYAVVTVLTPVVSAVVLFRFGFRLTRQDAHM